MQNEEKHKERPLLFIFMLLGAVFIAIVQYLFEQYK